MKVTKIVYCTGYKRISVYENNFSGAMKELSLTESVFFFARTKAAFVSFLASLLIVVFIADSANSLKGPKRSKVQEPEWLRLALRRRRARQVVRIDG